MSSVIMVCVNKPIVVNHSFKRKTVIYLKSVKNEGEAQIENGKDNN